jgi:hypothetical protein
MALVGGALWSWATICAATAVWLSRSNHVTVRGGVLTLAAASAVLLVGAATADLFFFPRAELLGIHSLAVNRPYTWWVWGRILLCEPVVTGVKLARYLPLLADQARREGRPVELRPRWTELLKQVGEAMLDWSSYVGRR